LAGKIYYLAEIIHFDFWNLGFQMCHRLGRVFGT